jgi:hypothetical protein
MHNSQLSCTLATLRDSAACFILGYDQRSSTLRTDLIAQAGEPFWRTVLNAIRGFLTMRSSKSG